MLAFAIVLAAVARMDGLSGGHRYDVVDEVPARSVALVFGNKIYSDGTPAPPLARRLETALRLYTGGRVRAVLVYGVRDAVLVSQAYHLSRAVALCRQVGIDAVGVSAGAGGISTLDLRRRELREDLACVKAVADLALRPDPARLGRRDSGIDDALRQSARRSGTAPGVDLG